MRPKNDEKTIFIKSGSTLKISKKNQSCKNRITVLKFWTEFFLPECAKSQTWPIVRKISRKNLEKNKLGPQILFLVFLRIKSNKI